MRRGALPLVVLALLAGAAGHGLVAAEPGGAGEYWRLDADGAGIPVAPPANASFADLAKLVSPPVSQRRFWVETKMDVNGEGLHYFRRVLESAGWVEAYSRGAPGIDWTLITRLRSRPFSRFPSRIRKSNTLINHFPGDRSLFNKEPFMVALRAELSQHGCDYRALHPETFRLHDAGDCAEVVKMYRKASEEQRSEQVWFTKIVDGSFGAGIKVESLRSVLVGRMRVSEADAMLERRSPQSVCTAGKAHLPNLGLLMQRGVMNPMLLEGHKFDMRVYVLIASSKPHWYVYYHDGVARRSARPYQASSTDKTVHLTNTAVQRAEKSMSADERTWLMNTQFREYVDRVHGEGVYERVFVKRLKRLMLAMVRGVMGRLQREEGYYLLLGADVIADDKLNLKVLEANTNPSLGFDPAGDKPTRRQQLWDMTAETMRLVYEVRQRTTVGAATNYDPRKMASARGYDLLLTDDPKGPYAYAPDECFTGE